MATLYTIDGGLSGLSVNFVWHSKTNRDYMLPNQSWAPPVPDLKMSALSGYGPYEPTIENRTIHVFGDTEMEASDNLEKVARLFYQAERYERGGYPYPVILRYQPEGSSVLHEARIVGRSSGDQSRMQLPTSFNEELRRFQITNVQLRFRRTEFVEIAGGENYLNNWSFEDDTAGSSAAPQWTSSNSPTLTIYNNEVFPGSLAPTHGDLMLNITGAVGADRGIYQDVIGLTVGARYVFSVDVRWDSGTIAIRATDGGGSANAVGIILDSGGTWVRQSVTKVCPASGSIRVWLLTLAGGAMFVDAAVLTIGGTDANAIDVNQSNVAFAGEPLLCTVGEHWAKSPIRAEILMCNSSGDEVATVFSHWPSYLVLSNSIDNIETVAASAFGVVAATWTKPGAVAGDRSYSGTLLRYTPVATTAVKDPSYAFTLGPLIPTYSRLNGVRVVVFLVLKASVANNFTIRGYISAATATLDYEVASEPVVITSTATQIVPLIFPAPLRATYIQGTIGLFLEATAAAASGTLDIDRAIAVNVSEGTDTTILRFNENLRYDSVPFFAGRLYADSIPTTHRAPEAGLVGATVATGELPFSTDGAPDIYITGPNVAGTWIAIGDARGTTPGTFWQWYDSTNTFAVRSRLRVTRRKVRTVPR